MFKLKQLTLSLASVLLLSGVALTVPVSARDGSNVNPPVLKGNDSSTSKSGSNDSSSSNDSTSDDNGGQTETEVENHSMTLREQFKSMAAQDLAAKKANVKEQSQADRQKVCENRQESITRHMSSAVKDAQAHKAVFDKIYAKVKAFHDSKGLSVSNYDALVATANQAQADAAASISALQALDISVDCTSQTVASTVSTFQQAVKATRDSLKTYRSDIVAIITALKGASSAGDSSSGGSQ